MKNAFAEPYSLSVSCRLQLIYSVITLGAMLAEKSSGGVFDAVTLKIPILGRTFAVGDALEGRGMEGTGLN